MSRILQLKEMIHDANNIVFFGGAGVSTDSGIPDYRSKHGLQSKFNLDYTKIVHIDFFKQEPTTFYQYYKSFMLHPQAKPNPTHDWLVELEKAGKLRGVITQNIDGLHTIAGSKTVVELHGSSHKYKCMRCLKSYTLEYVLNSDSDVPYCQYCGSVIRPAITLFGEDLEIDTQKQALNLILNAELLIVGGSSLAVMPAASFIHYFKGRHLVIINNEPTLYDRCANLVINMPLKEVISNLNIEQGIV